MQKSILEQLIAVCSQLPHPGNCRKGCNLKQCEERRSQYADRMALVNNLKSMLPPQWEFLSMIDPETIQRLWGFYAPVVEAPTARVVHNDPTGEYAVAWARNVRSKGLKLPETIYVSDADDSGREFQIEPVDTLQARIQAQQNSRISPIDEAERQKNAWLNGDEPG